MQTEIQGLLLVSFLFGLWFFSHALQFYWGPFVYCYVACRFFANYVQFGIGYVLVRTVGVTWLQFLLRRLSHSTSVSFFDSNYTSNLCLVTIVPRHWRGCWFYWLLWGKIVCQCYDYLLGSGLVYLVLYPMLCIFSPFTVEWFVYGPKNGIPNTAPFLCGH